MDDHDMKDNHRISSWWTAIRSKARPNIQLCTRRVQKNFPASSSATARILLLFVLLASSSLISIVVLVATTNNHNHNKNRVHHLYPPATLHNPTNIVDNKNKDSNSNSNNNNMSKTELSGFSFGVWGQVQGVYFRKYAQQQANTLGVGGWIRNDKSRGTVQGQVICDGEQQCHRMQEWLSKVGSPHSVIEEAQFTPLDQVSIRKLIVLQEQQELADGKNQMVFEIRKTKKR